MRGSWIISVVLGLAASVWLKVMHRKAESNTQALSIAPPPEIPIPGRFHIIPPAEWPSLGPNTIAALWYSGEIPPEAMPDLAADLMLRGFDGKWLRRCAGESRPVSADINEYVDEMFMEIGVEGPFNRAQALEMVGLFITHEVSEGRVEATAGAERIAALYDWEWPSDSIFSSLIELALKSEYESDDKRAENQKQIMALCSGLATGHEWQSPRHV